MEYSRATTPCPVLFAFILNKYGTAILKQNMVTILHLLWNVDYFVNINIDVDMEELMLYCDTNRFVATSYKWQDHHDI